MSQLACDKLLSSVYYVHFRQHRVANITHILHSNYIGMLSTANNMCMLSDISAKPSISFLFLSWSSPMSQ